MARQLASNSWGPVCLLLPISGVIGACHHTTFFLKMDPGDKTEFLTLVWQTCCQLNHLFSPILFCLETLPNENSVAGMTFSMIVIRMRFITFLLVREKLMSFSLCDEHACVQTFAHITLQTQFHTKYVTIYITNM